jgi:RNA polymerase sigma-70 factor (ECF subfamily)
MDSSAGWSDEEIVREARAARQDPELAARHLDVLFRRYQTRVAAWCLRFSGRREEAADLAQEVFLRVHQRLDTFRFESSFATWLYLVTRSVTINRSISNRRRDADSIDDESFLEPAAPGPSVEDEVGQALLVGQLRAAIAADLDPLEARILHLHFVDGLTLAAIDQLLELGNKSGARAYLVSAKRKLQRSFKAATARGGAGAQAVSSGRFPSTSESDTTPKPGKGAGRPEDPQGELS